MQLTADINTYANSFLYHSHFPSLLRAGRGETRLTVCGVRLTVPCLSRASIKVLTACYLAEHRHRAGGTVHLFERWPPCGARGLAGVNLGSVRHG